MAGLRPIIGIADPSVQKRVVDGFNDMADKVREPTRAPESSVVSGRGAAGASATRPE